MIQFDLVHIFQMGWFNHQPDHFTCMKICKSQKCPTKAAYKETVPTGVVAVAFGLSGYGWLVSGKLASEVP